MVSLLEIGTVGCRAKMRMTPLHVAVLSCKSARWTNLSGAAPEWRRPDITIREMSVISKFDMQLSSKKPEEKTKNKTHEPGAYTAWGLIFGGVTGALVGLMFGGWLMGAFLLGCVGGTVGALMDRSRL